MAQTPVQPTGLSLRDVVARTGSFDPLIPHLKAGGVMARAPGGFYNLRGEPKERADDRILPRWWTQLRNVDPAAGRAWFDMALADQIDDELLQRAHHPFGRNDVVTTDGVLLATGIMLEQAAVEALFPIATADTPKAAEPASVVAPPPASTTANAPEVLESPPRHGTLEQRVYDFMKKDRPQKGDRKYVANVWEALGRPGKKKTIQNFVGKYRRKLQVPKRIKSASARGHFQKR